RSCNSVCMSSPQQHGHSITFKAGCRNIEFAILVDVSEGEVICAGSGAERRAGRWNKPLSAAEPHCDAVDGGHDKIISPVTVDISEDQLPRTFSNFDRRARRGVKQGNL